MLTSWIALMLSQVQAQPMPPPIVPVPPPMSPRPRAVYTTPVPPPPAAYADLSTPPRLRGGAISNADYPAAAIRAEAEGVTGVTLSIGTDGRVTGCSVTSSAGNPALDSTTCMLMQRRFRFDPARRNGQPVAATWSTRVRWQLPDFQLIQFAEGRFAWTVALGAQGVTACAISLEGATFARLDENQCANFDNVRLVSTSAVEPGQRPAQVREVLSLLPQGETMRLPPLAGDPVRREVADLEIAPSGSVTSCTWVSQQGNLPPFVVAQYQPLCAVMMNSRRFVSDPAGAVRRARIESAIYVEPQQRGRGRRGR